MKNYKDYGYFENRPDVVKVWEDLESYHDWCRLQLCDFNPTDLYRRDSQNYGSYLASKRPKRPYQGNRPNFQKRS